jgi:sugar phosphate permease
LFLFKNNKNQEKNHLLKILIVLSVPSFILSFNHNGFLALLPFVREEFFLTRAQVGYYSTYFFISAAVLAVFTGSIVDNFGPKKSMLLGIASMSFVMLFYGFFSSYTIILFLALLAGLGFSIITPSVTKGVILVTSRENRAVSLGITQAGFGLGGIAGAGLLPLIAPLLNWRIAIQLAAIIALASGFLVYKFYHEQNKDNSPRESNKSRKEEQNNLSFRNSLILLFKNKYLFQVCVVGSVFGIAMGTVISHFAVFISDDLDKSKAIAGLGLGILQFGGIIGRPIWGWLSDKLLKGSRQSSLFLITLFTGIMYLFFGIFFNRLALDTGLIFVFSFLMGFSSLGWSGVHFTAVAEFAKEKQAGIATGLSLLFIRVGALFAPPIFGFIADLKGSYKHGWIVFGIFIIVSAFIFVGRIRSDKDSTSPI